jgi:hypothetical protein
MPARLPNRLPALSAILNHPAPRGKGSGSATDSANVPILKEAKAEDAKP